MSCHLRHLVTDRELLAAQLEPLQVALVNLLHPEPIQGAELVTRARHGAGPRDDAGVVADILDLDRPLGSRAIRLLLSGCPSHRRCVSRAAPSGH